MSASCRESKQENFLAKAVNEAKDSLNSVIDRQANATCMLMLKQTEAAEKIFLEIQSELQNAPANESIEHQFFRLLCLGHTEVGLHVIRKGKTSFNEFKPARLLDALHLVDLEGPRREFPPIMCINIMRALDIVLKHEDDSKGEKVFCKRLSQFNDMLVHIAKHVKELSDSEKFSYEQEVKLFETTCETYLVKHFETVTIFDKNVDLKAIEKSVKVKTLATMKRKQVVISWDRTKSEEVLVCKLHTLYLIVLLEKDLNHEAELKSDTEKAINAFEIHSTNDFAKQIHKDLFIAFKGLLEKVVGRKIKHKPLSAIKKSVTQSVDQPVNDSELKELINTGEKIEVILNRLVKSHDSFLNFHAMIFACKSKRYDLLDALMEKFTDLKDMGSTENIIETFMHSNQAYATSALYVEMARHLTKQKKTSQDKHLFLKKILNVLINPQFGLKVQIKNQLIIHRDKESVAIPYTDFMTILEEVWPVRNDQTLEKQFSKKLMDYSPAEKEQKTTTPVKTQQPAISIQQQYSESKMKFSQAKLPAEVELEYKALEQLRATVAGLCNSIDQKLKAKTLAKHQKTIHSYARLWDVTSYTEQCDVYSKLKQLYLNLCDRLNLTDEGAQLAYVSDVSSYLEKLSTFQNKLAADVACIAALTTAKEKLNQWIQADAQSLEKLAGKIQHQKTAKEKEEAEKEKINLLKQKKRAQQRKANKTNRSAEKGAGQGEGKSDVANEEKPPVLLNDTQVKPLQKAPESQVKTGQIKSKRAQRRAKSKQKGTTALVTQALTTPLSEQPDAAGRDEQSMKPASVATGPAFDEVPDVNPAEQPVQPMLGYSLFGKIIPSLPTLSNLVQTLGPR